MAGEGIFGPILSTLEKDPELKREAIPIDANLSRWYHDQAKKLKDDAAKDEALGKRITDRFETELPGLDAAYDRDRSLLEDLRPGGRQERRFSDLIRDSMVKQREAAKVGLDQARAGYKTRMALGGNSPFADSSYARLQYALPQMNLERQLAAQESAAQIDNAYRFLSGYRPGQSLALASQRQAYDMTPINIRNIVDAMRYGRANNIGAGIRQAEDATMYWKQPKNWATYVKALDDTGARAYQVAMSMYGMAGGGMGSPSSGNFSPTGPQGYGPTTTVQANPQQLANQNWSGASNWGNNYQIGSGFSGAGYGGFSSPAPSAAQGYNQTAFGLM